MSSFTITTPPVYEPVARNDVKNYLRIDHDADDNLIDSLIVAARSIAESYTHRAFITQIGTLWIDRLTDAVCTIKSDHLYGDDFPSTQGFIVLPRPPLQTVVAVTVIDDEDNEILWDDTNYIIDTSHEPGRLILNKGACWPSLTRAGMAMKITLRAGYGDEASDVPEGLKLAIMKLCADLYHNRGDEDTLGTKSAYHLLNPYRIMRTGVL